MLTTPWYDLFWKQKKKKYELDPFLVKREKHSHHDYIKIGKYIYLALSFPGQSEADFNVFLSERWLMNNDIFTNFRSKINGTSHDDNNIIYVQWPDMEVIEKEIFKKLISYIVTLSAKGYLIGIACHGGHGRTGTVLAGLAMRLEKRSSQEAIEEIRKRYCDRAVESLEQCNLLKEGEQ